MDRLEDTAGGRESFIDTIACLNLDKRQEHFLRLLCDPLRQRHSLITIARDAGLNPLQIFDMYHKASFAKANALAMAELSEKLPEIAKDIAEKSIDMKVDCPRCFGEGFESEGITCAVCLGRGEVFRPSDLDRQKIALEATGLVKKGGGVNVNVSQQNVNNVAPNNFFSKYVKASDDAAYDVSDIIDVTPEGED